MRIALPVALAFAACASPVPTTLRVDLRTDFLVGLEFTSVRTRVFGSEAEVEASAVAMSSDDYIAGVRVAEFAALSEPEVEVEVALLGPLGEQLASRTAAVRLEGSASVTLVITRSCAGVRCPPSEAPERTECHAGRCISPDCASGACLEAECVTDGDCDAPSCVEVRCVEGSCFRSPVDVRCADGGRCDPELGCTAGVFCGDGTCSTGAGENSCGCPEDCGTQCGDGCCVGGESTRNCEADCGTRCGDGHCGTGEDCATCRDDCGGDDCTCWIACCDGHQITYDSNDAQGCRDGWIFCNGHGPVWRMARGDNPFVVEQCIYQNPNPCPCCPYFCGDRAFGPPCDPDWLACPNHGSL